jgi:hypothetical protein
VEKVPPIGVQFSLDPQPQITQALRMAGIQKPNEKKARTLTVWSVSKDRKKMTTMLQESKRVNNPLLTDVM